MLKYLAIKDYRFAWRLNHLWNAEFGPSFPIKKDLYFSAELNDPNFNKDASFVALFDNDPVGFIFIKTWQKDQALMPNNNSAYISLIFVKKEMRNMGIGSDLLKLSVNEVKKYGNITTLCVGNDFNHIFPGVPNELSDAPIFFMNKDFVQREGVVDMIRIVRKDLIKEPVNLPIKVNIATEDEKDEILRLCMKNNWYTEAYAVNRYFENGGSGRRIVTGQIDGKIVAFARFNDRNKLPFKTNAIKRDKYSGTITMVRIDHDYDSIENLSSMIEATKYYLIKRGCSKVIILATKDIKFYKNLGYSAYKYYLNFEYRIKESS